MEKLKLNQERLEQVCFILSLCGYGKFNLTSSDDYVWLGLAVDDNFIPLYVLKEIEKLLGDCWGVARIGRDLFLMFGRENPDECLSIPDDLKE